MKYDMDEFIDLYFGDNLYSYQKFFIKIIGKSKDIKLNLRRPKVDKIAILKELKLDFNVATLQGVEEYKNGELVNTKPYNNQKKYIKIFFDEGVEIND